MSAILEAKNVKKIYKSNSKDSLVLNDVSLCIGKGDFVSVMGPSGSGKSTLLYALSGMERMSAGSVLFNRRKLETLSEEELSRLRLREMGFIFQHIHLLKNLSIKDNIIASAYLAGEEPRREINRRAGDLMDRTGIAGLADHDISQASGGQLQRAAICRALINHPGILFGDEPTGALNSQAASDIMDILTEINQGGTTIFLATHDIKIASKTSRVLFMKDGEIVGEYRNGPEGREERLAAWLFERGL